MALQPSQVTARSNGEALMIAGILAHAEIPAPVQMALIGAIVDAHRANVAGSTSERAAEDLARRYATTYRRGWVSPAATR